MEKTEASVNNVKKLSVFSIGSRKSVRLECEQIHDGTCDCYDPYEHRIEKNQTNNIETFIHLIKVSIGTGLLALPNAFAKAGWLNGIISTVLIGALSVYCLHLLVRSQYFLCTRQRCSKLSYPETMKLGLQIGPDAWRKYAPIAPTVVNTLIIIYQLGTGCVYIMFIAKNLKKLGDIYTPEKLPEGYYFLFILIPIVLVNCIRNLKILVPFSMIANFLTAAGVCSIFYYIFQDFPGLAERKSFGSIRDFFFYFGTAIFAFGIVPVVPTLENNMKTPQSFGGYFGILNIGMTIVTAMYTSLGFLGYVKYGDNVADSITLELDIDTDVVAQATLLMFTLAIYLSCSIQYFVPLNIIWNTDTVQRYVEKSEHKLALEYMLRMAIVLFTYCLAFMVPKLGSFISLFGCFCLSALALAFPALLDICVNWNDAKSPILIAKNAAIIALSVVCLLSGTYFNVADILT